jgi:hypothetical protein
MDFIDEQMYILFSQYYFEAFFYKNKVQIARVLQSVSFNSKFLVDFKRKRCYLIEIDRAFIKGHKIILHYDYDEFIPLQEITVTKTEEINNNLIKSTKITKLVGEATIEQKDKTKNKNINQYNFNPEKAFELFNGRFVTLTMSKPKTTDWGMVAIAIVVGVIIIAFMAIMVFGLK